MIEDIVLTNRAPTSPIRIVIADDHPALREGLAAIIETEPDFALVGKAGDGHEMLKLYRELQPDVVVIDVQMPKLGGIEGLQILRSEYSHARAIMLTTYPGDAQAVRALKAGAAGYLLKSSLGGQIIDIIRKVHAGERYVAPEVASAIALHVGDDPLSDREMAVLKLAAIGRYNREIAQQLKITDETVKAHMKSIFGKLNVSDRTHAVTVAIKRGVLEV